ncbi:cupin 2 [Metarhizium album ARSEF 1941]|uniref:Cupin 2 n=1 Tax=Metarhizium album (strain ARSEF 1941) TaxID=1081103 RepID=A0A0B2WG00_METAS|nr:cupin 2 [Metarhizium album ARSEF 1941]KHN94906.1 cupin 2 [Metarhizium album ARSEF 1941]
MSAFDKSYNLPAPRRITASNLPLPSHHATDDHAEPGVEVKVDDLEVQSLFDGSFRRAVIGTSKQLPTKNDGHGELPLDDVPGAGIVMPGGLNTYYLDIAPGTEGALHRTTSTDYVIVISGKLSLITPKPDVYHIKDGKATCAGDLVETVAHPGDVIYQRGPIHALSNRGNEWVRALCVVLGSQPNKVPVEEGGNHKELQDHWLA